MAKKAKIGVLGASGYTGSECVRLLLRHPRVELALLTADRRAGQEMRDVFPQFSPFALPTLASIDSVDWPRDRPPRCAIWPPPSGSPILPPTSAGTATRTRLPTCSRKRSTASPKSI